LHFIIQNIVQDIALNLALNITVGITVGAITNVEYLANIGGLVEGSNDGIILPI
jgi:hypothetical protein